MLYLCDAIERAVGKINTFSAKLHVHIFTVEREL